MEVVCALIIHKKKILIAQRPLSKSNPGLWEFPGGKKESHESLRQALVRELREELRIDFNEEAALPLGLFVNGKLRLHLFSLAYTGPIIPLEHRALAWVSNERLGDFPLCLTDKLAVEKYRAEIAELIKPFRIL